jgi:hypothetical protein
VSPGRSGLMDRIPSRLLTCGALAAALAAGVFWNLGSGLRAATNLGGVLTWRTIWYPVLCLALAWWLKACADLVGAVTKKHIFEGLSHFWRGVPRPQKTTMLLVGTLVLAGHLLHQDRRLFPFVRWGMYDTRYEPETMVAFEMYGITRAGERHHINIARTLPSIRRGAPMKFTRIVEEMERTGAAPAARLVEEVASSVATLQGESSRRTFTAVEIVKEIIHRDGPGMYRRDTQVLRRVSLRPVASHAGASPAIAP